MVKGKKKEMMVGPKSEMEMESGEMGESEMEMKPSYTPAQVAAALKTLQKAEEIQADESLMALVSEKAKSQAGLLKRISSIKELRALAEKMSGEDDEDEMEEGEEDEMES